MQTVLNLSGFILLLLVAIGGYIGWRYWDVAQLTSGSGQSHMHFYSRIKTARPFICSAVAGNFQGTVYASTYVAKGYIRNDFTTQPQGRTLHIITHPSNAQYVWWEGDREGCRFSSVSSGDDVSSLNLDADYQALLDQRSCEPWWLPDENIFRPPSDVFFEDCDDK